MIKKPLASANSAIVFPEVANNASRLSTKGPKDMTDGLKKGRNIFLASALLLPAAQLLLVDTVVAQDAVTSEKLERLIKEQQQQLESLQQQMDQLKNRAAEASMDGEKKVVSSGGPGKTKLSISGWVNRMVNVVDDGGETEAYFVDNDNSESRLKFRGTHEVSDDLTIGGYMELTIAPNRSVFVSQNSKERNNDFDQRWVEAYFDSKSLGKLSFGKGGVAAHGTGLQDLSGTNVIAYATIVDTAGGMLFREQGGTLTDIRILDAFHSFDSGQFRRNRVRYDTPTFGGFKLGATAMSDERYDGAVYWKGQGAGFKAKAAAGITDPNVDGRGNVIGGSFSVLHEDTGLNLTYSTGEWERDTGSDATNQYVKLGWRKRFNSFGETAFGVDYTKSEHISNPDDEATSTGLAVVQNFDKYGLEIYGSYRTHELDRAVGAPVDDLDVLTIGTRVKF
ncbi:MAG: porin [Candidatus Thiodiazotropha sp.]